jgi:hypothetical protein
MHFEIGYKQDFGRSRHRTHYPNRKNAERQGTKKAATEAAAMLSALYCSAELAEIYVSPAEFLLCRAE